MKQIIYCIAIGELVGPDYTDTETRICHNLGFYSNSESAKLKCLQVNAESLDADDSVHRDDIYYVKEFGLKD